ncbi:MAG: hypothetical protein HQK55_17510, partial [Deltaproteobacteria bacterium]|nr:hypothetical protein [Deltaproteobacteria bacterium]
MSVIQAFGDDQCDKILIYGLDIKTVMQSSQLKEAFFEKLFSMNEHYRRDAFKFHYVGEYGDIQPEYGRTVQTMESHGSEVRSEKHQQLVESLLAAYLSPEATSAWLSCMRTEFGIRVRDKSRSGPDFIIIFEWIAPVGNVPLICKTPTMINCVEVGNKIEGCELADKSQATVKFRQVDDKKPSLVVFNGVD